MSQTTQQQRQQALQALQNAPIAPSQSTEWVVAQSALAQVAPPSMELYRLHRSITERCQSLGITLPTVNYDLMFNGLRWYRTSRYDVVFSPLQDCLLYRALDNRLLAPPSVFDTLARLLAAGIDYPLYIAHDVPLNTLSGTPGQSIHPRDVPFEALMPQLPAGARRKFEVVQRSHQVYRQGFTTTLKSMAWGAAGIVAGTALVATLPLIGLLGAAAAANGLDPVLMLAVEDPSQTINGQRPALFYKIDQWIWGEE